MAILIDSRFRGPDDSGNGGYSCGVIALEHGGSEPEVTLRLPPPLDRPLAIETDGAERAMMRDGDALVAEAGPIGELNLALPDPPSVDEAAAARDRSPMQHEHPFPNCFVCGPERKLGDGLQVTCGPVEGRQIVAAPWVVDESLPVEDGGVAPEIVWSALDCPGGISAMLLPTVGTSVLGRLAARIYGRIEPGMCCVAVGWPIDRDGRKLHSGSAIFSAEGEPLAHAQATWIELKR